MLIIVELRHTQQQDEISSSTWIIPDTSNSLFPHFLRQ